MKPWRYLDIKSGMIKSSYFDLKNASGIILLGTTKCLTYASLQHSNVYFTYDYNTLDISSEINKQCGSK